MVVDATAVHHAIEQAKAGDVQALLLVVDAAADDDAAELVAQLKELAGADPADVRQAVAEVLAGAGIPVQLADRVTPTPACAARSP